MSCCRVPYWKFVDILNYFYADVEVKVSLLNVLGVCAYYVYNCDKSSPGTWCSAKFSKKHSSNYYFTI